MADFETDYLVVGAGATGMAFVDSLLDTTDAHITLVDKHHKPGGHWNDAYPFVRLHQPSSYYGLNSMPLGDRRIDLDGTNKGFEELASGTDVAGYFHTAMRDRFLTSGRVRYMPMSEQTGAEGEVRNLLSGKRTHIGIRRRLVDARICENGIPLTHKRNFQVAPDVTCIPPNALPRVASNHTRFTVLGAGKTAMDTLVWLIENGATADQLSWVVPRDPWTINRAFSQASGAFYHSTMTSIIRQMQAMQTSRTVDDLAQAMEDAGIWMRLDPAVKPEIMHGATLSEAELRHLRGVGNIIRLGHVTSLEASQMVLAGGTIKAAPDTLYIDCTARALGHTKTWPIFTAERIGLQMIRLYQPTFSAALLAQIEALDIDDKAKNALATPVPMTDSPKDWIKSQIATTMNQVAWAQVPRLRDWIAASRLDGFGRPSREVDRNDPEVKALYLQVKSLSMPAFAGMQRLVST